MVRELIDLHCPPGTRQAEVHGAPVVGYICTHTRWLAAYLAQLRAGSEHLPLGVLYQEKCEGKVLRELGVSFEGAYTATTGVEPPEAVRPHRPSYVAIGHLQPLLRKLPQVLPVGVSFGFNFDDELAWLSTSSDVVLDDYIERALSSAGR